MNRNKSVDFFDIEKNNKALHDDYKKKWNEHFHSMKMQWKHYQSTRRVITITSKCSILRHWIIIISKRTQYLAIRSKSEFLSTDISQTKSIEGKYRKEFFFFFAVAPPNRSPSAVSKRKRKKKRTQHKSRIKANIWIRMNILSNKTKKYTEHNVIAEEKKVKKKQFDDNENPARNIRRMQSFYLLLFGIIHEFRDIWDLFAHWSRRTRKEKEREREWLSWEPFAKYLFMRATILTMYGRNSISCFRNI